MKAIVIEAGERLKGRIVSCAVELFVGEFDLFFQTVNVAILKQGIPEHGAEGRGHRHREPEVNAIVDKALHHIEQGEIGFGDCLVKPILLEKLGIFGMPYEGKVGVEDGSYVSNGHGIRSGVSWSEGGCRGRFRGGGWSRVSDRSRFGGGGVRSFQRNQSCDVEDNHPRDRKRSFRSIGRRPTGEWRKKTEKDGPRVVGVRVLGQELPPGGDSFG